MGKKFKLSFLSVAFMFMLLSLTLLGGCRSDEPKPDPVTFTDIITQCEKDSNPTIEFTEEFMEYLATRETYFTVIRFEEANRHRGNLPRIYKRTINLTTETVSHELVPINQVHWEENTNVTIETREFRGLMYPRNIANHIIDEIIKVWITDANGHDLKNLTTRVRVVREPILVESVHLRADGTNGQIRNGQTVILQSTVLPANASFRSNDHIIESLVVNGETVKGDNVYQFVGIDGGGSLARVTITEHMNIGDMINIVAINSFCGTISNVLTLTVVG